MQPELITYYILSGIMFIMVLLPLIHKKHWVFRAFEFPRLQKLFIGLILVIYGIIVWEDTIIFIVVELGLIACCIFAIYLIFPFTPLSAKSTEDIPAAKAKDSIKLFIANVYQPSKRYDSVLRRIEEEEPDIIFLVETDNCWTKSMELLSEKYSFKISRPLDNMYGLLFYTRMEVVDKEVLHWVKDDIPSIRLTMKTKNGREFRFYGIHPEPPSPTENPYATDRDVELLKVANECKEEELPVVIAGDLNDVAWSYTTERFLEISGLKDPRKGRGIYSTFNARYWWLRWPLDHIFCTSHYKLVQMRRLRKIGSDHFPILVELSLEE